MIPKTGNEVTDNLFGGVEFLGKMFSVHWILGVVMSAILMCLWIAYAIVKHNMKWKLALKKASDSLAEVAKESSNMNDNVNSGDDWNPNP